MRAVPVFGAVVDERFHQEIARNDNESAEDKHNPLAPRIYEGGCPSAAQDRGEYAVQGRFY